MTVDVLHPQEIKKESVHSFQGSKFYFISGHFNFILQMLHDRLNKKSCICQSPFHVNFSLPTTFFPAHSYIFIFYKVKKVNQQEKCQ